MNRWQAVEFDDAAKERIKEAADFERSLRLEAFLNAPSEIKPFKLRPLTARDALELEYAENRFATGDFPMIDDFVHLLWLVRVDEERDEKAFAKFVTLNLNSENRNEIMCWYNAQFNDTPSVGGSQAVDRFDSSVWLCSLFDGLASEYGWTIDHMLEKPLSVLFQQLQRTLKRKLGNQYAIRNGITQAAKAKEMKHG